MKTDALGNRRTRMLAFLFAFAGVSPAHGQSLTDELPPHPTEPVTPPPKQPPPSAQESVASPTRPGADQEPSLQDPGQLKAPIVQDAPVEYPEGGSGSGIVILELLVNVDGLVQEATVIVGRDPFGTAAKRSALTWRFTPAQANGKPVAARIRFEVQYEPPEKPEKPQKPLPTSSSNSKSPTSAAPIQEVLVQGKRSEGQRKLSRAEVRQLPGTFGDAFRAIEVLPGVTPLLSGLPYFYVRGAPPGNVGYFLDGVRVPLLFHIAAGPSVIHPAFIDNVELYAGPYPARYGRFSGGIVAGETAPPKYKTRAEASIRILDAGGMIETHALDKDLSVMVAGRYSYLALIGSLINPDLDISYWDYQGRIEYRVDERSSVSLFAFGALDKAFEGDDDDRVQIFDLTFHRYDLRYDRAFEDGGNMRLATTFGTDVSGADGYDLENRLIGGRLEVNQPLSDALLLRAGADVQTDRYQPRLDNDLEMDPSELDPFPARQDVSTGLRADAVWSAKKGIRVIPGIRFDFFIANDAPLWALSPRLYAEFDIQKNLTFVHGLGVAHQLPSFLLPLPGVQPAGERGLQRAIQHSAGVRWQLPEGISAEATVFQNIMTNLTDGLGTIAHQGDEFDFEKRSIGSGRGLEILLRRPLTERLGGFIAYTLSHSRRSLDRRVGPASFDRTHVLGAALGYQIGRGWSAGARASFYTGVPAQLLGPGFNFGNPPRTTPFYRFDWRVEKRWKIGTEGAWWALVAEALNTTLNREEISLDCESRPCVREEVGPITIPSIGVEASL